LHNRQQQQLKALLSSRLLLLQLLQRLKAPQTHKQPVKMQQPRQDQKHQQQQHQRLRMQSQWKKHNRQQQWHWKGLQYNGLLLLL
jgi:hypothetical protein